MCKTVHNKLRDAVGVKLFLLVFILHPRMYQALSSGAQVLQRNLVSKAYSMNLLVGSLAHFLCVILASFSADTIPCSYNRNPDLTQASLLFPSHLNPW